MAGPILKIECNPEIECSNTGTISGFENIYPGFQTTRKISIINNRNVQCDLQLQTQFNNPDSYIFKHTNFSLSDNVLVPNQKKDVTMRIYVSTKADNNFANLYEKIDLNFKINCVVPSTSSGTVAGISTSHKPFEWWWLYIFFAFLIYLSLLRLAKNHE